MGNLRGHSSYFTVDICKTELGEPGTREALPRIHVISWFAQRHYAANSLL